MTFKLVKSRPNAEKCVPLGLSAFQSINLICLNTIKQLSFSDSTTSLQQVSFQMILLESKSISIIILELAGSDRSGSLKRVYANSELHQL